MFALSLGVEAQGPMGLGMAGEAEKACAHPTARVHRPSRNKMWKKGIGLAGGRLGS